MNRWGTTPNGNRYAFRSTETGMPRGWLTLPAGSDPPINIRYDVRLKDHRQLAVDLIFHESPLRGRWRAQWNGKPVGSGDYEPEDAGLPIWLLNLLSHDAEQDWIDLVVASCAV